MHAKLLTIGLVLSAMHLPAWGQGYPRQSYRMAQSPAAAPQPAAGSAIRVIQPATSYPQPIQQAAPQLMQHPVPPPPIPQSNEVSVLDPPAAEGAMSVDFNQILSDEEAVACGCSGPACPAACVECQDGCDQACCMAAFFGRDPCVPPPPIGRDPLVDCSIESVYRAESHHRGLWATYPAEKMRESLQLRRSRVMPAPPECYTGPTLHQPRAVCCPAEPECVEACPQPDECCSTPNNTSVQQAQRKAPAIPR
ncbi:hypothetical protein Poly24_04780 [Rosistilla carotiformis]|uniref:Uncharacterized protein n=1 Tax=Rosistilla carotiformis TaxID=2528017 RepID=A0A518JMK6_9BACT|nr:hypothetical protein [Rosistilla carotiformis]QDV66790.1 hypothetical protein Poly24_04780 [Rosistilla carotiformis]